MDTLPELSWPLIAGFVRQHTHDVRNDLNGLDLEAALLRELVSDAEAKASVDRLRRQIRDLAMNLRGLSAKFAEPQGVQSPVAARDLFLIWQDQVAKVDPVPTVDWQDGVGEARVKVDIECMARTFAELLKNAVNFGDGSPLKAEATLVNGEIVFRLTETKKKAVDPVSWGNQPLQSTRHGSYGLGLWEARRGVCASGGRIEHAYDPASKTLTTTLAFPLLTV